MFAKAWAWMTDLGNSKVLALLIFMPLFLAIVAWVYGNRRRSERLESYKYMPFLDEEPEGDQKGELK